MMAQSVGATIWDLAGEKSGNLPGGEDHMQFYRLNDLQLAAIAVKYPHTDGWYDQNRARFYLERVQESTEGQYLQHIVKQKEHLFRRAMLDFCRKMDVLGVQYAAGETEESKIWINIDGVANYEADQSHL